jgi:NTE family protein
MSGKMQFKKLGLVLGGGGGRGAYQVGVLKALMESGLLDKVSLFSGTSVGSLNSVLFCHKSLALAHYIWLSAIEESILYFEKNKVSNDFTRWKVLFQQLKGEGNDLQALKDLVTSSQLPLGIFSRDGLVHILESHIDWNLIKDRTPAIYATATSTLTKKAKSFLLNDLSTSTAIDVLLASSAIPGIFNPVPIAGEQYYDGGLNENLPIDIAYNNGCDLIITVSLFKNFDKIKSRDIYPNAHIIELAPENSLGGVLGLLDFTRKSVRSHMSAGYIENQELIAAISNLFTIDSPQYTVPLLPK